MSEVFAYHPKGGETLAAFNARVAQFCSDNPVVDIDARMYLNVGLSMAVIEAADVDFALVKALQPVVISLTEVEAITLERTVAEYQKRLLKQQPDISVFRHKVVSSPLCVYVVFILHAYDIATEDDGQPDQGGDQ